MQYDAINGALKEWILDDFSVSMCFFFLSSDVSFWLNFFIFTNIPGSFFHPPNVLLDSPSQGDPNFLLLLPSAEVRGGLHGQRGTVQLRRCQG